MSYTERENKWKAAKRRVRQAERKAEPGAILAASDEAAAVFRAIGYPDDWHYVQRAADDAEFGARLY